MSLLLISKNASSFVYMNMETFVLYLIMFLQSIEVWILIRHWQHFIKRKRRGSDQSFSIQFTLNKYLVSSMLRKFDLIASLILNTVPT